MLLITSSSAILVVLLSCVQRMSFNDPTLSTWAAVHIFAKTVTQADEQSDSHVILTFESNHPYKASEKLLKQEIYVPFAKKLLIQFDPLCCTDNAADTLTFYEDPECTTILRQGKTLQSFS